MDVETALKEKSKLQRQVEKDASLLEDLKRAEEHEQDVAGDTQALADDVKRRTSELGRVTGARLEFERKLALNGQHLHRADEDNIEFFRDDIKPDVEVKNDTVFEWLREDIG